MDRPDLRGPDGRWRARAATRAAGGRAVRPARLRRPAVLRRGQERASVILGRDRRLPDRLHRRRRRRRPAGGARLGSPLRRRDRDDADRQRDHLRDRAAVAGRRRGPARPSETIAAGLTPFSSGTRSSSPWRPGSSRSRGGSSGADRTTARCRVAGASLHRVRYRASMDDAMRATTGIPGCTARTRRRGVSTARRCSCSGPARGRSCSRSRTRRSRPASTTTPTSGRTRGAGWPGRCAAT